LPAGTAVCENIRINPLTQAVAGCGDNDRAEMYEPYVHALSTYLLMPVGRWLPEHEKTPTGWAADGNIQKRPLQYIIIGFLTTKLEFGR